MLEKISRNISWLLPAVIAAVLLKPAISEINTILLVILFECLAIALSALALYAYTRIDFIREHQEVAIGKIFLGVHILVGLCVLGVYIAQFSI